MFYHYKFKRMNVSERTQKNKLPYSFNNLFTQTALQNVVSMIQKIDDSRIYQGKEHYTLPEVKALVLTYCSELLDEMIVENVEKKE